MASARYDDVLPPEVAAQDNSTSVVAVTVCMTLVATLFITLRIYGCVFILRRPLYFEEWLSVINQIDLWLTAAFVINLYTATKAGRHWATLTAAERTSTLFWHNVLTAPSVLGLGLPKLAVVSLTCRIFKPCQLHRNILWFLAILCVLNFVGVILLAWLPCQPIEAVWDVQIVHKRCLDPWIYVKYCYYATTFSAALDFYLALYPAFVFRQLGWGLQKRFTLSLIMGLGMFASGVASYKISTLQVLTFTTDFSYHVSGAIIWTVVEANVIMIAACAPTLHPVYDHVRKKLVNLCSRYDQSSTSPSAGSNVAAPYHQRRSFFHRDIHNQTPKTSEKVPGFWTAVLALNTGSSTFSTLTTQRTDQTRHSRGLTTVPVTTDDGNCEAKKSPTTTVPMRTLEDAVESDTVSSAHESSVEGGVDKAQLKLYHALQSRE